jgi:hypothetical protein
MTNGQRLIKWGPWIATGVLLAGLAWNQFIQPRLAVSFVTAEKGTAMSTRIKSNEEKGRKLELRLQRVEDAVVYTKDALIDIKSSIDDLRRRKR